MIRQHEIDQQFRDGSVRCDCGSDFPTLADYEAHHINARIEEREREARKEEQRRSDWKGFGK